ncbi:MAG: 6-phosphofructokinase [Clostridia bacterium]|nr:6-phosphofructokinase [Clostridia bacterium]
MLKGAAVIGQSGGPTAAINATLAGVIKGCFNNRDTITKVYGMKNGIEGFLKEDLINLTNYFESDTEEKLNILAATPAAALGSCRKKLPAPDADKEFFDNLIELFRKYDIRYFFYIGGNDSMDTVAKLTKYLESSDYEMRVMGVPKTIDNDLQATDHTPGYGSAAKYIAATMSEIIRDCAVYKIPAVTIVEIMGRDAGWLTAASALPRIVSGEAPDLVYLPEVDFDTNGFIEKVKSCLADHPNVVIAVSEGIRGADGKYVGEGTQSGVADVFGHKYLSGTGKFLEQLVKAEIGCKVRSVELNISQRCAAHLRSETDINESIGVGCAAAESAANGTTGCMMAMNRAEDKYEITYEAKAIANIANMVKTVPAEFITKDGSNVTDECLEYILPMIQGEAKNYYKKGLPVHLIF